jgi:hypothetical protein
MGDWELAYELQKDQQRFEAALKFATTDCIMLSNGTYMKPGLDQAIEMADALIAKLEEPRRDSQEVQARTP